MNTVQEQALLMPCGDDTLLGILSLPRSPAMAPVGVVIIVGGPQYRVGSHRQFVLLARHLASAGVATLRFDVRGMGDSTGASRSFEDLDDDIAAAVDALLRHAPQVKNVALWGLCDGASAALLYMAQHRDERVLGTALLNPWIRTAESKARTNLKHYYTRRLRDKAFWIKLLRGGISLRSPGELWSTLMQARSQVKTATPARAAYPQRMAQGWRNLRRPMLLLLSDADYTAREFDEYTRNDPVWRAAMTEHPPRRIDLQGADHTLSSPDAVQAVNEHTLAWLRSL